MTCAESDALLEAWLRGALSDADARRLEEHAAECAVCGPKLEEISRITGPSREVLPSPGLRISTLQRIANRRRQRVWRQGVAIAGGMAAVIVGAVLLRAAVKSASRIAPSSENVRAEERARPQLTKLDAAEKDLSHELTVHPEDAEVKRALARIRHQREVLEQMLKDVAP